MSSPEFFDSAAQVELLSEEALDHEQLSLFVELAESRILGRYRQEGEVRLKGYDEEPIDSGLERAMQLVAARMVEHFADEPENPRVESITQGAKSVTFREEEQSAPRHLWSPLKPYDERSPLWRW